MYAESKLPLLLLRLLWRAREVRDVWLIARLDKPADDPQVRGDVFKTLFVARLSYDTKETDLEREFGRFGPIERVSGSPSDLACLTFHNSLWPGCISYVLR